MLRKRPSNERGQTKLSWLTSFHTFSFGDYHDAQQMGFRSLRVINDDRVAPGMGFGTHGHKNAEIISYVISGSLEHRDSMGNGAVIEAGNLQYMSAGSGVQHSEFNPSPNEPTHFIQIWLLPKQPGGAPRYAERSLASLTTGDTFSLLCAPDEELNSGPPIADSGHISIRQDARLYFGSLTSGSVRQYETSPDRGLWIHLISGNLTVLEQTPHDGTQSATLSPGDGLAIEHVSLIDLNSQGSSQFLLFDLA